MELSGENNIKEIAFCCLSTGIFGFPKKESAQIAVNTIIKWIMTKRYKLNRIVFNVFTYEDHLIYQELLSENYIEYDTLSYI